MKPQVFLIAAGIPASIDRDFVAGIHMRADRTEVFACPPLERSEGYSEAYAEAMYKSFCGKIRQRSGREGRDVLQRANVVLVFLEKNDGSSRILNEKFGTEALVLPIQGVDLKALVLDTGNQRNEAVGDLVKRCKRAIDQARSHLSVIAEEFGNRENRTCLLLPPRNFGKEMRRVRQCVDRAISGGLDAEAFQKSVRSVEDRLKSRRMDQKRCFVGKNGIVFASPPKAGARHGEVPDWGSKGHDISCILRGRIRFGVSYGRTFHYDCALPSRKRVKRLPSCHGKETLQGAGKHVNIAPNDNVR